MGKPVRTTTTTTTTLPAVAVCSQSTTTREEYYACCGKHPSVGGECNAPQWVFLRNAAAHHDDHAPGTTTVGSSPDAPDPLPRAHLLLNVLRDEV
jgi:hypothetical protein